MSVSTTRAWNDLSSADVAKLYAAEIHGDDTYRPTNADVAGTSSKFAAARADGSWSAEWDGLKVVVRYVDGSLYDMSITEGN